MNRTAPVRKRLESDRAMHFVWAFAYTDRLQSDCSSIAQIVGVVDCC